MKVSWRDEMKCQVSTSFSTIDLTDSCDIPETPQSSYGSLLDLPETPIRKTVFLVRHGEALHNIAEKSALQETLATLANRDFPNEDVKREALEIARRSVLTDEGLKDAPLSANGHEQAGITATTMSKIVDEDADLKAPEAVFVSPLQRALQTAALMFPKHNEVHVCDLLRERCTGFPCDERSEVPSLQSRKSFCHMSFDQVMQDDDDDNAVCNVEQEVELEPPIFRRFHTWPLIEEKFMLRKRTAGLGKLLQGTDADSVCIVTHKGFLRELERGPLGQPQASEFSNCEVRVYDVCVCDGEILRAELRRVSD